MPLPLLAVGLAAAGKIMGGIGSLRAGSARAKALGYQARNARQEAGVRASIQLEESDRIGARAATLAAASGGGGLQGSAMSVIEDLARQGVYRARQVVRDGLSESIALKQEATTARRQGQADFAGSVIDAGSTVLGGMAQQAQMRRAAGSAPGRTDKWFL